MRGDIEMKDAIETIYQRWSGEYSGTLLVSSGDETVYSAVNGFAHKGFLMPNHLDTKFDCASVTKTFTAAAILLLVERDLLHLDDRIADIIDLEGTEISKDVTIEHLLTHTSGIADDADEEAGEDYDALFIDKPNYSIRQCRDFLPQFAYKPANFAPGTNVRYNNCAFVLLGLAIEQVTGKGYREYVMEHIFEACGMHNSRFCAMDEVNPNTAEGYIKETDADGNLVKWRKNIYSYPPIGTADGGAYTTVGDLATFLRAVQEERLLSPELSKLFLSPHCGHTRAHRHGTWRMGYAFEFVEDEAGKTLCMYKDGMNAGVEAMFSYYPTLNLSVNLLSNENGVLYNIHRDLQAYFLSEI